jgi:hypothetical protein
MNTYIKKFKCGDFKFQMKIDIPDAKISDIRFYDMIVSSTKKPANKFPFYKEYRITIPTGNDSIYDTIKLYVNKAMSDVESWIEVTTNMETREILPEEIALKSMNFKITKWNTPTD